MSCLGLKHFSLFFLFCLFVYYLLIGLNVHSNLLQLIRDGGKWEMGTYVLPSTQRILKMKSVSSREPICFCRETDFQMLRNHLCTFKLLILLTHVETSYSCSYTFHLWSHLTPVYTLYACSQILLTLIHLKLADTSYI